MNLEYLNNEYNRLKTSLQTEKANYEVMRNRAQTLQGERLVWSATKETEQRAGNAAGVAAANRELGRIKTELKQLRKDALKQRELISHIQADIDAKFAQIESDPSLKQHLDKVIVKKYDRQLTKLEKEKENKEKENAELPARKLRIASLRTFVKRDDDTKKHLTGFLVAKRALMDFENELKGLEVVPKTNPVSYTNPVRATQLKTILIPQATQKVDVNKRLLRSDITKHKLTIKDEDILALCDYGLVKDATGKLKLDETLKNAIPSIDKKMKRNSNEIKMIDKRISDHQTVLGKHGATHTPVGTPPTPPTPPTPQPKWWQFGKRFKNWNERRKQGRLPVTTTPTAPTPTSAINTKAFKDSMKYDIVKDLVEKTQKDERKAAKQERTTGGSGR